jgi:hypothetical protein
LLNDNVTDLNFILEVDELDNPVISYDYVDFNELIEQYDGT